MKTYRINPLDHERQPHNLGYRNCVVGADGALRVRPSLRSFTTSIAADFVFGFSVRSPNTGEMSHYVGSRSLSGVLTIQVWDEQLSTKYSHVVGRVPDGAIPTTYATVVSPNTNNLEILISSPFFSPVYGLIGGALTYANRVASVNPGTTAIDLPRGLTVGLSGRAVLADGRVLFISDAEAPRTFTPINASGFDGVIYGLHPLPGGNLAIVTDRGAYYLPADAFFSGQQVAGIFQPLSDYRATGYEQTTVADGRLFGLSRNGMRELTNDLAEIELSDPHMPLSLVEPVGREDFRSCRMLGADEGPVIATPEGNRFCPVDLERGFFSWWETASSPGKLVGILRERDGTALYVTEGRILRAYGNTEWTGSDVWGTVLATVVTPPAESQVGRHITSSSDSAGNQRTSLRGTTAQTKASPQSGVVIGTTTWGSTTAIESAPLRSRRTDYAIRSDDHTLEVQHQYSGTRIGKIEFATRGIGKRRRTN